MGALQLGSATSTACVDGSCLTTPAQDSALFGQANNKSDDRHRRKYEKENLCDFDCARCDSAKAKHSSDQRND